MKHWLIENSMGVSAPFLERSLIKRKRGKILQTKNDDFCSTLYILGLVPLEADTIQMPLTSKLLIRGYQKRENYRINNIESTLYLEYENGEYKLNNETSAKIHSYSCWDETFLYISFIFEKKLKYYFCKFTGCKTLRNAEVFVYEIMLFKKNGFIEVKNNPSFKMNFKSVNKKNKRNKNALHYNWVDNQEDTKMQSCSIYTDSGVYNLTNAMCIFCFRTFNSLKSLTFHINSFHYNYYCDYENDKLTLVTLEHNNILQTNFCHIKIERRNKRRYIKDSYKIRKDYFVPEIMTALETKKVNIKWLIYLTDKKLEEIIDLPDEKISIMKKWNAFIMNKKIAPILGTMFLYVQEFVMSHPPSTDIFDFLVVLHSKCILSFNEVKDIIYNKLLTINK